MTIVLCKPCVGEVPAPDTTEIQKPHRQSDQLRNKTGKKLKLVARLLSDSPIARRVDGATNAEAEQFITSARSNLEEASKLFDAGNISQADAMLNTALASVSSASRLVKDRQQQEVLNKQHYEQLRERVMSFSEAFERILDEKRDPALYSLVDLEDVAGNLKSAEQHAGMGDHQSANMILQEATAKVEHALSIARDKETLLHELKFDSPRDELDYEMQRNRSYELLIGMMENKHEGSAIRHFRAAVERNREVRVDAEKLAKQGDYERAIKRLEESTRQLARTLRMSGLVF